MIRPLRHLDAPGRRLGGQEKGRLSLCSGQAARGSHFGGRYQFLAVGKDLPQSRGPVSLEAVTTRLSSGLNAALNTLSGWCMTAIELRESISHSRAVLSQDAVTMRLPSELNATLLTMSV